jgi:hypothetical protein
VSHNQSQEISSAEFVARNPTHVPKIVPNHRFLQSISNDLQPADKVHDDGRSRYSHHQRIEIYHFMVQTIKRIQPKLQIGLCLEHTSVFEDLGMKQTIGQCNCLL